MGILAHHQVGAIAMKPVISLMFWGVLALGCQSTEGDQERAPQADASPNGVPDLGAFPDTGDMALAHDAGGEPDTGDTPDQGPPPPMAVVVGVGQTTPTQVMDKMESMGLSWALLRPSGGWSGRWRRRRLLLFLPGGHYPHRWTM